MMSIPIIIATFLLLCTYTAKAEFKTLLSREESNPNTDDIYGFTSLKNASLTYKICRNGDSKNIKICKIFQEHFNSETKLSKFCEVTLNGEVDDENVDVVAFGTDKAVISWHDDAEENEFFVRYTIVHFSDCKTAEAKISFSNSEDRFLSQAYNFDVILRKDEHTFDVVFENSTLCGEKVCRVTFDDLGNQISDPIAWFAALDDSFIYIHPNSMNGVYLINEIVPNEDRIRISVLKPDDLVILKEFNNTNIDETTGYDLIRICYFRDSQNTSVTCDLFNPVGEFDSTISVDFNYEVEDIDVLNTDDRGFILMISTKPSDSGFRFYVTKVEVTGTKSEPIEVPEFECKDVTDEKHSNLFENKQGEYCASRVCHTGDKYNVLSKCFTIDDLTTAVGVVI